MARQESQGRESDGEKAIKRSYQQYMGRKQEMKNEREAMPHGRMQINRNEFV